MLIVGIRGGVSAKAVVVVAMTDGVWKYVGWARVRELATTLAGDELLTALQTAGRLRCAAAMRRQP